MSQATLSARPYTNSDLFSGHYLDERIQGREEWQCDDAAREAMDRLRSLYDLEGELVEGYGEDALIDNWIDEVLEVLGFGSTVETALPDGGGFVDVLLFEDPDARREAASVSLDAKATSDLFEGAVGIVEAKRWDADFTERFSERRPYRNASHQIKHYLERTPENVRWGILTNGRKWRLYGTMDYETRTYYEVDLPELLERGDLEAFKYFYTVFRPDAFRESAGRTFLDAVRSESETAAQELGADLQDNVFTALRVLGKGFVETNDLDLDPDAGDGDLDELKEQSLVLLYRLLFVLYAESRGLIHPEGQAAAEEYEENFSLDALRLEIHDEIGEIDDGFDAYSEHSTTMWSRLEDLFRLIDEGEESLGIPPYNGGLFDREKHAFLAANEVSNRYLAEVVYRVSTTENDDGRYVQADYADLDTRHLGSVYEGLLEHRFRIAPVDYAAVEADGSQVWKPATEVTVAEAVETVSEGGLYVVNDEGERKATGAYYTPDYVVTYIVEETVGPLVAEIRADLLEQGLEPGTHEYLGAFYRRLTDLKVLDPAMGSGHFLTRATEYLAREVMDEVRELEEATAFDERRVRRDVAKECIYGVDLNGMAVELAKLSMWLETLAADQPLAFLDHHLKTGNSLVGSDVTRVLSNGDAEENGGQLTLQQSFARVRERTLDHVMDLMAELLEIDNQTLADVKSMEDIYAEVRADPFYQRLFELTSVHTAAHFDLDVPADAYERMAGAIDDDEKWAELDADDWFRTAQAMADEETFFHWELEFPEVFFDEDGRKREDGGFDAVIGNPPYVRPHNVESKVKSYLWEAYDRTYRAKSDLLNCFLQLSSERVRSGGGVGMITSDTWRVLDSARGLREYVLEHCRIRQFGVLPPNVFEDASVETVCVFLSPEPRERARTSNVVTVETVASDREVVSIPQEEYDDRNAVFFVLSEAEYELREKIESVSVDLGDVARVDFGLKTGDDSKYLSAESTTPEDERLLSSTDVHRYLATWDGTYVRYVPAEMKAHRSTARPGSRERFEREKVIVSRMSDRPTAVVDYSKRYVKDALLVRAESRYSHEYICAVINSTLLDFYYSSVYTTVDLHRNELLRFPLREVSNSATADGETVEEAMRRCERYLAGETSRSHVTSVLETRTDTAEYVTHHDVLTELVSKRADHTERRHRLNRSLLDYLGSYSDGRSLAEIGLSQPPEGTADSPLTDAATDRENLRVGEVEIARESPTAVEIRLTARYKPEDEDDHETDRWGYTETEFLPALRISDLTETEADLIEAFVPVAVDEAGGFANFRETATKTNSLVDRLRKLTLPTVADVRDGLESYRETNARAEELEAKIEKTDELIDRIVYELYGLTAEEIEIVEETVGE